MVAKNGVGMLAISVVLQVAMLYETAKYLNLSIFQAKQIRTFIVLSYGVLYIREQF